MRMYKIWDYLKRNTDREHPIIKLKEMREDETIERYMGDKETFNRLIKDMAWALNWDETECKPREERKIYFQSFEEYCEEWKKSLAEEVDDESQEGFFEEYNKRSMHLKKLYYNRTFSYQEIDALIESIWGSGTLDMKTSQQLIEKIEENLTTKFYKKSARHICKAMKPELADREQLRENLLTIQKAINNNVQVCFQFNGYTYDKKLEANGKKYTVSPYYIVADGGRYYLLACMPHEKNGHTEKKMSIWRIDLMTEIDIPGANEELGIPGNRRIPKKKVENLPLEWDESFQLKHLNMSFDRPERIKLRIKSEKRADDPTQRVRADYTFLHDWFGDRFQFIESEKEPPYDDIVTVECSPYGMVNWALQYSDRVEVLEPEHVRREVVRKVEALARKYGLKCKNDTRAE